MKNLKFRKILAEEILAGRKTSTWRFFDDKDLQAGDVVDLIEWETRTKFAAAKIKIIREKKLGEVHDEDFDGHEKYESKEAMLEEFRTYYGDKVDWDTLVKIIDFELLV